MTEPTETYPPLPPSPVTSLGASKPEPPPYIRTSFSSGYIRSNSAYAISSSSPITSSPSTPSLRRHSQSRGHRHTKSLNAQSNPPPLPLPKGDVDAGYTSNKEDSSDRIETDIRQWRSKHSETMSPASGPLANRAVTLPTLPVCMPLVRIRVQLTLSSQDNPKLWTPSQLAQYLLTALRFKASKSSEVVTVPKPVAQDIANFVVKCKLNGRVFLRLAERDMEE
jgi:hypothetical protein